MSRMEMLIRRLLQRFHIDSAVLFTVLTQGWSLIGGPAALLAVARVLTAEQQGFYYTFGSVLALQVFVELGLATVITQTASHEWAFLTLHPDGTIGGEGRALSRLRSLARISLRWYIVCSALATVGLGAGGFAFFSLRHYSDIDWQAPWLCLCAMAGLALIATPLVALIEGCNQVAATARLRCFQAIVSTASLVAALLLGFGLYALAIAAGARLLIAIAFLSISRGRFLRHLFHPAGDATVKWRTEVWPFQWRIGVSWIAGYFIYSIFTPTIFLFCGAKTAGQWGMTWTVVVMVESVSYAWLSTRMPQFGILIASRRFNELDALFRRLLTITVCVAVAGSLAVLVLVTILRRSGLAYGDRLLPTFPVILLLGQRVLNVVIAALAYYLRAHKREPMMIPSLAAAVLIASSTWLVTPRYGALGAALAFLSVTILWTLPSACIVFKRSRHNWHK